MILTGQTFEKKITKDNIDYYNLLGYDVKLKDIITIPPEHLPKGSHTIIKVKCDVCNKVEKILEYRFYLKNIKNYNIYTCSEKCSVIKCKKTKKDKYGDKNYNNRKQCKETCLEIYGVEHPMMLNETKEKYKQTCLENYGVEWSLRSPEVREKGRITCLDKFGFEYASQSEDVMKRVMDTKFERYGDPTFVNPEKCRQTNLEKYGVECVFQLEEIKEISKQTKEEKFGDKNYNNREKMFETKYGYSYNEYLEKLPDFIRYRNEVYKITKKQPLYLLENIEKRGQFDYHLDHMFTICEGFRQNIPVYIVGNIINLEMLTCSDNLSKHNNCSLTKEQLFERYDNRDKILEQLKENYNK